MQAELDLTETEPTTHTAHSHWRQCMLCEDYTLNKEELKQFYEYYREANILFEGENQRWDLFKELYVVYFDQPAQTSGKQWLRLGFQGQYPETDLRGGGVLALKLILRFVKNNLELVRIMEHDKGNFFFAITAINIEFFMKKYFHLDNCLVAERDQADYCNRRGLKNFCRIITSERFTFEQMHEIFLKHFYNDMWLKQQVKHPNTLLQFNSLFSQFKKKVEITFQDHSLHDFHQFINTWRAVSD